MAYNPDAPVFADRYRFEPVEKDWDRGRSGYTHLVYDLKEKRLGVIKRAETLSEQATEALKNEVAALTALKGLGVPEVYDTGQAVYGSKNYFYIVIEHMDGIRVERNLNSLDVVERAKILTQFFGLLTQAHQKGIVNGDVDLKHLFWRKDKKQLVIIDWGNAKLNVDPNKKMEFAYDMARAAEIIFSLVTRQGHPLATGSIALPDASELVAGLGALPVEFGNLCKWAPRTPSDGAQAPHTAKELFEVSKKWLDAVIRSKPYKPNKKPWLVGILLLGIICFALLTIFVFKFFGLPVASVTPTVTLTETSSPVPPTGTPILTEALSLTTTPIHEIQPPTQSTEIPPTIPSPLNYSPLLVFTDKLLPEESRTCINNEIPSVGLNELEGFYNQSYLDSREDWWVFNVGNGRGTNELVQTDFAPCLQNELGAVALNASVTRLVPWKKGENAGNEFGLFLEDQEGHRREYTLWMDESEMMHLRIREGNQMTDKEVLLVASVDHSRIDGILYNHFILQIFLEVNNHGTDILYMLESPSEKMKFQDINPSKMIRIDAATRPSLGDIHKVGLVGRGGQTTVIVWPLAFLGR
jgi:serine/threonine protein kinase